MASGARAGTSAGQEMEMALKRINFYDAPPPPTLRKACGKCGQRFKCELTKQREASAASGPGERCAGASAAPASAA